MLNIKKGLWEGGGIKFVLRVIYKDFVTEKHKKKIKKNVTEKLNLNSLNEYYHFEKSNSM